MSVALRELPTGRWEIAISSEIGIKCVRLTQSQLECLRDQINNMVSPECASLPATETR